MPHQLIAQFEQLIRRDPARRGLISSEESYGPLCLGHLLEAASHLAEFATHVGLVTGFYVPHASPPSAETDGPLGTVMLAMALESVGVDVCLLTDEHCAGAVLAAAEVAGLDANRLVVYPHDSPEWIERFFTHGYGKRLTHLVAIERVGPSHTVESVRSQARSSEASVEDFCRHVPAESHDCCHNMRGHVIDEQTSDMYRLFDELPRFRPHAKTVGIGDGANEIGMGSIPWEELHRRLHGEHAGRIPCRVATDWNIVAGTSNWGGYALAAAVLLLRNNTETMRDWSSQHQRQILEYIVEHGPAVDGITAKQEATVDGLPFVTYIQPWIGIRRLLGFED